MNSQLLGTVQVKRDGWYAHHCWIVTKGGVATCVAAFARDGLGADLAGRVIGTEYAARGNDSKPVNMTRSELACMLLKCRRRGYRFVREA